MEFIEAKRKNVSCVYCLTFPNGMRYIGKAKDLSKRIDLYLKFSECNNKHLQGLIDEFGLDAIDVSILTQVSCKKDVDLDICLSLLEIKYIREMDTLYPSGLNVSLGGEVLGIPIEYITTDAEIIKSRQNGEKSILVYDLEGKFVEEHSSIARFSYDKGVDEDSVRGWIGKMKPYKDKWYLRFKRYDYAPLRIEVPIYEVKERVKYRDVIEERIVERKRVKYRFIPALKYDMNGRFCGEYPSKVEACRSFLKNSTCNWAEYRGGYILFKKVGEDYPKEIEPYYVLQKKILKDYYVPADELADKDLLDSFTDIGKTTHPLCINGKYTNIKHQFRVGQYSLTGELISTFDSIRDASHETGIAYSQIYACVKGTCKKSAGYKWHRIE